MDIDCYEGCLKFNLILFPTFLKIKEGDSNLTASILKGGLKFWVQYCLCPLLLVTMSKIVFLVMNLGNVLSSLDYLVDLVCLALFCLVFCYAFVLAILVFVLRQLNKSSFWFGLAGFTIFGLLIFIVCKYLL